MSDNEVTKMNWHEAREHAKTRPTMYLGSQETGHKLAVQTLMRLVWQAKVFRQPQAVIIDLSPTQYIVRAECGPLIRPVQQIFSFGTGDTLGEHWQEEMKQHWQQQKTDILRHDWRYCFSGPTGPRLAEPSYQFILAHFGAWGLRTNDGLWCESYREGIPAGRPFLLTEPSPIGLLSCAALDPEYFTGLPFTEEDANTFAGLSHKRYKSHPKYEPRPLWTAGEIVARWHPQDDLISDSILTADGLRTLL